MPTDDILPADLPAQDTPRLAKPPAAIACVGSTLELTISTLTNLGVGLGRLEGWVIMVPGSLPGERVRVRLFRHYKQYSLADLLEVCVPSPQRVQPQCPLFNTCGGCQYQHLSYEGQLEWKTRHVQDALERIGKLSFAVSPAVGSPQVWGYRSKLTPHFNQPVPGRSLSIGFLRQGSHRHVVDVPQCPLATPAINAALPAVRQHVLQQAHTLKRGATLLLRSLGDSPQVCTDPKAVVEETVCGLRYRFVAGEFFQNNPFLLPQLVTYVMEQAQAFGVPYLVDAYCGVGLFALAAHTRFRQVFGIEISGAAVALARSNATLNGIENVTFTEGSAENIFETLPCQGAQTVLVIDPPRRGCDEAFLDQVLQYKPRGIVYVSCAPDTQARDLAYWCTRGYRLAGMQPFDLFPQTRHIESVATLQLVSS